MKRIIDVTLTTQTNLNIFTPNKPLIHLIKQLKQHNGTACYIISNLDSTTYALLEQQCPQVFALFNDVVISSHVGLLKPSPAIYEHLLTKEGLAPDTCLFVDDQPENIESAQQVGINGIVYTGIRALRKQLQKLHLIV